MLFAVTALVMTLRMNVSYLLVALVSCGIARLLSLVARASGTLTGGYSAWVACGCSALAAAILCREACLSLWGMLGCCPG